MSLLSWNCRGLGNPRTVKALQKVINQQDPILVFLMETKISEEKAVSVRDKCNFSHSWVVPSAGRSGGLALFWKDGIEVEILDADHSHIDTLVKGGVSMNWWHLTGFYGAPETSRREESWALLKLIRDRSTLPWLVVGDFNEIACASEKEGGSSRQRRQMKLFTETLNWCGLRDMGFVGPRFTWLYQTADGGQIRERLDRVVASSAWAERFREARVHHLSNSASDHSVLALHFFLKQRKRFKRKLFRFESMWLSDPRCENVVKNAWEEGSMDAGSFPISRCMELCRSRLESWSKGEFGHVGLKITELQRRLEWLELQAASPANISAMRETRVELNCWLDRESAMWLQRSRLNWFQAGDQNTRYFHARASSRYKKNSILGLLDSYGRWQEDEHKIEDIITSHYRALFSSNGPTDFAELLDAIHPRVSTSMNQMLNRTFQGSEVYSALKQMYPLKSPGPDGIDRKSVV